MGDAYDERNGILMSTGYKLDMQRPGSLVGKKVEFFDTKKGFWRHGSCTKEDKKFRWYADCLGKRYKLLKTEDVIIKEN